MNLLSNRNVVLSQRILFGLVTAFHAAYPEHSVAPEPAGTAGFLEYAVAAAEQAE